MATATSTGYCMRCKATATVTADHDEDGRPATQGTCAVCATKVFKIGAASRSRVSPRLLTCERSQVGGKPWEVESARAQCVTVAGVRNCSSAVRCARAWPAVRSTTRRVCARIVDRERQFCLSLVLTEYHQHPEIRRPRGAVCQERRPATFAAVTRRAAWPTTADLGFVPRRTTQRSHGANKTGPPTEMA